MLDLANKWRNYEKKIAEYLLVRERTYAESECKRRLVKRYHNLRSAIDLSGGRSTHTRLAYQHDFATKIKMPLVREAYNLRKASLRANYRNDPLFTLVPVADTPRENARNLQDAVNYNLKRTKFRAKALNPLVNMVAACGAGVVYSDWVAQSRKMRQTVPTPMGAMQVMATKDTYNVVNRHIHPLNYIQNPGYVDPEDSDYQGHYETWTLAKLMSRAKAEPDLYIKKNVEAVLKEAKDGAMQNDSMVHVAKQEDWNALSVDVNIWWAQLQITRNEDDETYYYVEMIGDKIIRLEPGYYDEDLRPYSIFGLDPRPDVWWSNTDPEMQLGFENVLNSVLQMQMDNAIRNLQQFIFLDKQLGVDAAMINRAHLNGGFLYVDVKDANRHISHMIHREQGHEVSLGGLNDAIREAKEGSQRIKPKADYFRTASEGGPQNKTATAASFMEEEANVQEADYATAFNMGLARMGYVNGTMLKQLLPDEFYMRPDPRMPGASKYDKLAILGDCDYTVETSMTRNKLQQVMKLQNVITGIMNFKGTGDPAFQNFNIAPIVKEWVNALDLPADTEEVYNDQMAMPNPAMGMGGMGQPQPELPDAAGAANMGGEPGQIQVGAQLEGAVA